MRLFGYLVLSSLLLTTQATGQEARKGSVGFQSGWANPGKMVREDLHHVRLGNMGNDVYVGASLDAPVKGRWDFTANVLFMPTQLYVWPKAGEINRFSWRPENDKGCTPGAGGYEGGCMFVTEAINWSCLTAGARYHLNRYVSASAGGGLCGVSGGTYWWGALPMHFETMRTDLKAMIPVGEKGAAGINCAGHPAYLRRKRLTVMRLVGSDNNGPRSHEIGIVDRGNWIMPLNCGFAFEARF